MLIQLTEVPELVECIGDCYDDQEWELVQYCLDTDDDKIYQYAGISGNDMNSEVDNMPSQEDIIMGFKAYATYVWETRHDPLGLADHLEINFEEGEDESDGS